MKFLLLLKKANFGLLFLLAVSTGLVKLFRMPEEMALFRHCHWSDTSILVFGFFQVVCGVLLIPSGTRKMASLFLAVSFVTATGVVWGNNMPEFAIVSVLFIIMALWSFFDPLSFSTSKSVN